VLRRLRRKNPEQQETIEVLKKARGLLREGIDEVAVRYAFIDAEKASERNPDGHGVSLMCKVLGVSRSGYYAWRAARPDAATPAMIRRTPPTAPGGSQPHCLARDGGLTGRGSSA
jgi:hypothetical protein